MPTPKFYNPRRMIIQHALEREQINDEYDVCKKFGCGKRLSLLESLAGKFCTEHMSNQKTDINKHLLK